MGIGGYLGSFINTPLCKTTGFQRKSANGVVGKFLHLLMSFAPLIL